jgi:hypothetical protein
MKVPFSIRAVALKALRHLEKGPAAEHETPQPAFCDGMPATHGPERDAYIAGWNAAHKRWRGWANSWPMEDLRALLAWIDERHSAHDVSNGEGRDYRPEDA